jgi:hypothetical protein
MSNIGGNFGRRSVIFIKRCRRCYTICDQRPRLLSSAPRTQPRIKFLPPVVFFGPAFAILRRNKFLISAAAVEAPRADFSRDGFRDFSRPRECKPTRAPSMHVSDAIKAQSSNLPMYATIHTVMPLCIVSFRSHYR